MACLEKTNEVVGLFQAESDDKVARLTAVQYGAGVAATVVFIAFLGVARGVTDRRRVEATLRLQSSALESAANAMVITDREGYITWVNPAFTRLTGYLSEEVLGQTPRILKSGQQNDVLYRELWETILSGEVWHGEIVNRHKDGHDYTEEMTVTPVLDQHGNVGHFIAVKQDITKRKLNEKLIRQQEKQLMHVSRLSTMGEMAAGFAHELNQPLGAISNYASNCLHLLESGNTNGLRRDLTEIVSIAHRGGEVIRRIRQFAKRQGPKRTSVDVTQLTANVLAFVKREARLHDIVIRHDTHDAPATISADFVQLEQVLLNLALNGIEAMAQSKQKEKTLTINTTRDKEGNVVFSVLDTGDGIPPDHLDQVYEAFFTTKPDGLGMGLAICNTIIRAHEGSLDISSEPGRGTLVRVSIPLGKR